MSEVNTTLIDYIRRLTELTKSRKVQWQRANPTVYIWDVESLTKKTRTTIQEATNRVRTRTGSLYEQKTYLFQIQDLRDKANAVFVDSKERPEYQEPMQELYLQAGLSIDARTADLLGDLLNEFGS